MVVKSLRPAGHTHAPEQGESYIVYACVYNINRDGGLEYCVEKKITDGRSTPDTLVFDDAKNFEVVDSHIPDDWKAAELDVKGRQVAAIASCEAAGNLALAEKLKKDLETWGENPPRIVAVSFPEMLDYDFFIAVHDDNMEAMHHTVLHRYMKKYEALYAQYL